MCVYGIVYFEKVELDKYLVMFEERKLRDYRKIGKDLDIFMIS